jgi:phospholipid transport system substrate-binding protein
MILIRKCLTWLLPIFLLASVGASAAVNAPETLVKNVTEEVLAILHEDKDIQSGNRKRAVTLIESKVAPHFDFARMTSLAVGVHWRQASAEQRKVLIGEFRTLLVRTYANSLTAFRDQTVSFKPSPNQSGDEVTIHSQINKPGGQPISLDYSLTKAESDWKVFDVAIANVSLVTNYRSSFASEVEKGGIEGLIKSLQEKNHRV